MSLDRVEQAEYEEFDNAQMDAAYPVCFFCGRPVQQGRDYRKVEGWVGGPGKDGFVRDGYGTDWAHKVCIDVNKTVGIDQQGLF